MASRADPSARTLLLAAEPQAAPNELTAAGGEFRALDDSASELGAQYEAAGACVMFRALDSSSERTVQALRSVYSLLRPDAPLLLIDSHKDSGKHVRRDQLATALFAAGFIEPVFYTGPQRDTAVVARRGALAPPGERETTLSVVMPVYNERETFDKVITELLSKSIEGVAIEVIIVESNSSDGTREDVLAHADHPRVRVVLEERPSGKGHAVRTGLAAARGDFVLIQDADSEYDISDYDALVAPLQRCETSFVLGYRMRTHGARWGVRHFEKQVLVGLLMNVGNAIFLRLFNAVYRSRLRDPFTMYKVFRRDCIFRLRLECNRFDFDWELTGKLLRSGYHPLEIPVSYQSRSFSEGKKVSILGDPLSWVVACFKYRFAPLYDEET